MSFTPEQITAMVAAISGLITLLFSPKIVKAIMTLGNWWRQISESRRAQRLKDEALNVRGHKYIILKQDLRITELETLVNRLDERYRNELASIKSAHDARLEKLMQDHQTCREENARLEERVSQLEEDLQEYRTKGD